eukprot:SAG31_NODE_42049_length_273_cov_0.833333_1_plen_23_part_10
MKGCTAVYTWISRPGRASRHRSE